MANLKMKPDMMVLGDSLAQGCRSLSVTKKYCAESWGARIAASQDWQFDTPDHPRVVVFDLEKIIRKFELLLGPVIPLIAGKSLVKGIQSNVRQWEAELRASKGPSAHSAFHNLAVTGSEIPQLYEMTYAKAKEKVLTTIESTDLSNLKELFGAILDLHVHINFAFVLNPQHKSAFKDRTPIDWVQVRKPRRVYIQTGHNHGLWDTGFLADNRLITYADLKSNAGIEELADHLARLDESIQEIHYCLLPKVSAVANLEGRGHLEGNYFEEYRPVLAPTAEVHSRDEIQAIDRSVLETNLEIQHRFREIFEKVKPNNSNRLRFVDIYDILDRYDFKNTGNPQAVLKIGGARVNNRKLDGRTIRRGPPGKKKFRGYKLNDGGFLSFDGMHPSGVGYVLIACEILKNMGLSYNREKMMKLAFKQDKLLSNYTDNVDVTYAIIKLIQSALRKADGPPVVEDFSDSEKIPFDQMIKLIAEPYLARGN